MTELGLQMCQKIQNSTEGVALSSHHIRADGFGTTYSRGL